MNLLNRYFGICLTAPLLFTTLAISPAQTFTTLTDFDGTTGATPGPAMQLVQGLDGFLYGTATAGGNFNSGTIFRVNTATGFVTRAYSFDSGDAYIPAGGLVLAANGTFYGTTEFGGPSNLGAVFSFSPNGTLTIIGKDFGGVLGAYPLAGLMQAPNGVLYGTTAQSLTPNASTMFKITPAGTDFTLLQNLDASAAYVTLVQAADGNFYGTTITGGTKMMGEIFMTNPPGDLYILHNFSGNDGQYPYTGLVLGPHGLLYGVTFYGGSENVGTIFSFTTGGTLTTLHSFHFANNGYKQGYNPIAVLVVGSDGNLYGTTSAGGSVDSGVIFKITPAGQYTVLHNFSTTDASPQSGGLVQSTDGNFYGTLSGGGASNLGIVYKLSTGLPPFVKTLPGAGKVGSTIDILGTKLTGATSVTFNGTPATFQVRQSGALITAVVPSGATSGIVQVTTPNGTLSSNVAFSVH